MDAYFQHTSRLESNSSTVGRDLTKNYNENFFSRKDVGAGWKVKIATVL